MRRGIGSLAGCDLPFYLFWCTWLLCTVLCTSDARAEVTFLNTWGSVGGDNGQFFGPVHLAVSPARQLYVPECGNHRIQRFDEFGTFELTWGVLGTGNGEFDFPIAVEVSSSGQVYVADNINYRIQRFDADGNFEFEWGTFGTGSGQFNGPADVAVNASGQIYVSDMFNDRIQRFDANGTFELAWGSFGSETGQFDQPDGVAIGAAGQVYVVDNINWRVQRFDADGNFELTWGTFGSGNGQFDLPSGVAVNANGQVYVTDTNNNRVQRFDADGNFELAWGTSGIGNGEFDGPRGVAVHPSGLVYVSDYFNHRVQRFFDSEAWVSGTNTFTDDALGPTSVAVGPSEILGPSLTLDAPKGLIVGDTTTIAAGGSLSIEGGTLVTDMIDHTNGGTLNFTSGTLQVNTFDGELVNQGGTLAPGTSTAISTISDDYIQGSDATLQIELGGTDNSNPAGAEFDVVQVADVAVLLGTLDVVLVDEFVPSAGNSFVIMTFDVRAGEFAQVNGAGLINGNTYLLTQYSANDLTLSAVIPGDGNLSGDVGPADYTIWANGFAVGDEFTEGDYNGDGNVGPADYTIWANNFGLMVSAPAGARAAVPEPSTLLLFMIAAVGVIRTPRRWVARKSRTA